jgi:hypothetical protein
VTFLWFDTDGVFPKSLIDGRKAKSKKSNTNLLVDNTQQPTWGLLLGWRTNFSSSFGSLSTFAPTDILQSGFLSYLQLQQTIWLQPKLTNKKSQPSSKPKLVARN